MTKDKLIIKNLKENNLKNISIDITHDNLTVVTGRSGSGKSTLAFDTIYSEGQRRYLETFSSYTRQFFSKIKKPDLDYIDNVRPSIAIEQKTRVFNSRSTVGTITGINDHLKNLFANISEPFCPNTNKKLVHWNTSKIFKELQSLKFKSTLYIGFIYEVKNPKNYQFEIEFLISNGYLRIFNTKTNTIEKINSILKKTKTKEFIVIIDRAKKETISKPKLQDSISSAFTHGDLIVIDQDTNKQTIFTKDISKQTDFKISHHKLTPSLFSFNSNIGACPSCTGFGKILIPTEKSLILNPNLCIAEGAINCWATPSYRLIKSKFLTFCKIEKICTKTPWLKLSKKEKKIIFNGNKNFIGITTWFKRLERKSYKMHIKVFLSKHREQVDCPDCLGSKLKKESLLYKINDKNISEVSNLSFDKLIDYFKTLKTIYKNNKKAKEIISKAEIQINTLIDLGLNYLSLNRLSKSLSGGETQRVNIASTLNSSLVTTQFVLDEPTVGLHSKDTEKLINTITNIKNTGNSVLVVEHDPDFIKKADTIIEVGPEGGNKGGEISYHGNYNAWKNKDKLTFEFNKSELKPKNFLKVKNANKRNLKNLDLDIPLNCLTVITGVSGSGKSTLCHQVISKAWDNYNLKIKTTDNQVSGFNQISDLKIINQTPLAKSPRSNIATYSKIYTYIRELFSNTQKAKSLKLTSSYFSFNVKNGRCLECEGNGYIKENLQFLSDIFVTCDKCLGERFQDFILNIKYNNKNISQVLNLTIDQALDFFIDTPRIAKKLLTLQKLGLSYLKLNHSLSMLSGGEAQRLKLASIISSKETNNLLIFDEPTTGLHVEDIKLLQSCFNELIANGNSLLVIEHNLQLISFSDYIIDLGPSGGDKGGEVIKTGSFNDFYSKKLNPKSYTQIAIKDFKKNLNKKPTKLNKTKQKKTGKIKELTILGAKEHNLKNIDIRFALNSITAITGVSGSGKSTIAKDIIFSEGQRRYLNCLSTYARQFIKGLTEPDIRQISGVQPSICIGQHLSQPSKLSTVGTISEVYSYLRLLYSKIGIQFCPDHPSEKIVPLSVQDLSLIIKKYNKKIKVLAPIIRNKKGFHKDILNQPENSELIGFRINNKYIPMHTDLELERNINHDIDYVTASFNPSNFPIEVINEICSLTLNLGNNNLIINDGKKDINYNTEKSCSICNQGFSKLDPEDFSFNSRRGKCSNCSGFGSVNDKLCNICLGSRLNSKSNNVKINDLTIFELTKQKPLEIKKIINSIKTTNFNNKLIEPIVLELNKKIDSLINLGLNHLELNRPCRNLSSGELQRLRISSAFNSNLTGAMYILDEPSAGLHPNDNQLVLNEIKKLKEENNTILLIEHDFKTIEVAENIIETGPSGGEKGGEITFNGPFAKFKKENKDFFQIPNIVKNKNKYKNYLNIKNANINNLKNLSLKIPLNQIVTICGVSGAGKSSLLKSSIFDTLTIGKQKENNYSLKKIKIESDLEINKTIIINKNPIGANSRSTPASYLKIWDEVRKLFALSISAKARGWGASHFSYNTGKGRCQECSGLGEVKLDLNFLEQARQKCEVCNQTRFKTDTLQIKYKEKSISDVLNMTFKTANDFFKSNKKIHPKIELANQLGLGYLRLGQSSKTLSGGECQRIKLISELSAKTVKHNLYILEEPSIGLHRQDNDLLITVLKELKNRGNSIFIVEHDEDYIANSDHIIEMGPGAGDAGGKILFNDNINKLKKSKLSIWKDFLI